MLTRTVNTQHGQSVIHSVSSDLAVVYGICMWYANERVAAKPYDDGELAVICVVNWIENEQDWKGTIHINCYSVDL